MATLNKTRRPSRYTFEKAPAVNLSDQEGLRRTVLSCLLWEDTFYEDGERIADRISRLCGNVTLEFISKLAIQAREEYNLRHVPLLLVREMVRRGGTSLISQTLTRVIQRPDEITEFLSIYWKDGKTPLASQVKIGLANAFNKFNEYQLAKYNRTNKSVTLRDAIFLCHPVPDSVEQQEMWDRLVDGKLEVPDTWEVALSAKKDKKTSWERLLAEGKLGGLALLRNLRNMQSVSVSEDLIRDAINKNNFNRVLPFRFLSAAKHAPTLEDVLEQAMFRALEDVPKLQGRTALVLDHSGSMIYNNISERSDLSRADTASALAILARELCENVDIYAYSRDCWRVRPRRGFALGEAYKTSGKWGGTRTGHAVNVVKESNNYDRIIILSDDQSSDTVGTPGKAMGYMINVAPYENAVGYGDWTRISGWSESVLKYIFLSEHM